MKEEESIRKEQETVEVAPLTLVGKNPLVTLSYTTPRTCVPGTIVNVPLRKKNTIGVVIKKTEETNSKIKRFFVLKKINSIDNKKSLTKEQILLAQKIAQEYITPLGLTLKIFFPLAQTMQRKEEKKEPNAETKKFPDNSTSKWKEIKKQTKKGRCCLIIDQDTNQWNHIIKDACKDALKNKKTLLLCQPDTMEATLKHKDLKEIFGSHVTIIHGEQTQKQRKGAIQKITQNDGIIIVGTRTALLAPIKNLSTIILENEERHTYKQWDRTPRYDGRTVAKILADIHGAKLITHSRFPRQETLLKKEKLILTIGKEQKNKDTIIDMRKERWKDINGIKQKPNYSPISKALHQAITNTLTHKKEALIIVKQGGMGSFTICKECKTVLRCKKCDKPLTKTKEYAYMCITCKTPPDPLIACSKCNKTQLQSVGIGTEKIEQEIKRQFPRSTILRADKTTIKKTQEREKLIEKVKKNKISIIVGTEMTMGLTTLPNIGIIGIIDFDKWSASPEWNADEKALTIAITLKKMPHQKLCIQTYQPESTVITALSDTGQQWRKEDEESRKDMLYPPFARLIKMSKVFTKKSTAQKESEKTCDTIKKTLIEQKMIHKVSPPREPIMKKRQKGITMEIILRLKQDKFTQETKDLLWTYYKKQWSIDVDPEQTI
ncbi:MAG: hypothetical protein KC736_03225 [Candidatus Moranbacteria bacterium]|nr:hypothetical protein [Candidatus Moranbacteria bacterium]